MALLKHPIRGIREEGWTRYDPRPSAWDVAFQGMGSGFVRVRMSDGTWFAGSYGPDSYASSYPDPHSIFVEAAYDIDETGMIGAQITNTTGAVIDCSNAVLIELLSPDPATDEAQSDQGGYSA